MKKIIILFILIAEVLFCQPGQEWVARYNPSQPTEISTGMQMDASGNIYAIGYTRTASADWIVVKFNNNGVLQWDILYNGPLNNNDETASIAISNAAGSIFVAGFERGPNASPRTLVTKKISFSGSQIWTKKFTSGDDQPYKIATSKFGNIFVAGRTNESALLIKYNQNGDSLWVKKYQYLNTINYGFVDIAVDSSEFIYAAGRSGNDFVTVKFNSEGAIVWEKIYDGTANDIDEPAAIGFDNHGNVYAAGKSRGTGTDYDFVVVSYDDSGNQRWVSRLGYQHTDEASSLYIDNSNNVYVAGYVEDPSPNGGATNFKTVKYSSSGNIQWEREFNNIYNFWDISKSIAVDNYGGVYVTGRSGRPGGLGLPPDYNTVKYDANGMLQWVMNYNGVPNESQEDIPEAVIVDDLLNVYVTGTSIGPNGYDICTIKYSQPVGIHTITPEIPEEFSLEQNYPNPFNPATKIQFRIPKSGFVNIIVYDILGSEITTLVNEELSPGIYEADWNGSNQPSGVYFYRIKTNEAVEVRKMVLAK